jgi:undecaprenyl pyrophosphate phosphatase UppP
MLLEPITEGRNAHATLFQVYFHDPFLAYAYAASLAFFVGLHQAFKVLGYARRNQTISQAAVNTLRKMKYCAFLTAGAIVGAEVYIMATHGQDDAAGAIMLGLIATFAAVVIGTGTAVLEKVLQNAVDIKSENDLTV